MRKTLTLALLLTIALIGVASPTPSLPRARNLTILYFNDIHGHLEPWKPDAKSDATIGGIARIATVVERIRRENRALRRSTVLLQAGDILQGTPLSAVYQGEPDIECFNIMGVDAMTLGNHEFDFGKSNVAKLVERADFPILSANVFWTDGRPFARASTVVESNGLRVGILGLTTAETPSTTFPTNVADLTFDDPIRAARYAVPVLEPHCDIVIALTHLGIPEDRRLAAAVPAIDVIVGGHTHAKLITPERVGNTVIVQAQDYGRFLGRLDLRIEPDGRVLTERAEFKVRPYDEVINLFQAEDVKKLGPRDVAALTRADYVLVCDVEQFDLQNDVINLGRGRARAKVRLFKVERRTPDEEAREAERAKERQAAADRAGIPLGSTDTGGRYVREDTIEAVFPSDYHNDYGRLDLKAAEIQEGLMGVISRKVAKLYYTHDEEKIEVE